LNCKQVSISAIKVK